MLEKYLVLAAIRINKVLHAQDALGRDAHARLARVLFDMLLLAARAGRFWPTPGSTMSQTVCFWRAAWGLDGAAAINSCEDICVAP